MEKELEQNEKNKEVGEEEELTSLIKQAGVEARMKKREVMIQHYNKLREVIKEAMTHKQGSLPA